jgi:hypothetical protein
MQVEEMDRMEQLLQNPPATMSELCAIMSRVCVNVRAALGEGQEAQEYMLARSREAPAMPDIPEPEIAPTQSPPRNKRWQQGHISSRQPENIIYDQPSPPRAHEEPPTHTYHVSSPTYQEQPYHQSHRDSPSFSGSGLTGHFGGGTSASVPQASFDLDGTFNFPALSLGVSVPQQQVQELPRDSFGNYPGSGYFHGDSSARPASDIPESSSRHSQTFDFLEMLTVPDYAVDHNVPPYHSQHDMSSPGSQAFSQDAFGTYYSPPMLRNRETINPPNRFTPG